MSNPTILQLQKTSFPFSKNILSSSIRIKTANSTDQKLLIIQKPQSRQIHTSQNNIRKSLETSEQYRPTGKNEDFFDKEYTFFEFFV